MARSKHIGRLVILALVACGCVGCSTFRGIPGHGGGKRFDEEQRVVAGAIRYAVADMELKELHGKKVQILVDSIAQKGAGKMTPPGLGSLGAQWQGEHGGKQTDAARPDFPGVRQSKVDTDTHKHADEGTLKASIKPSMSYGSSAVSSEGDRSYLTAAVRMSARHQGIKVVSGTPQVRLFVMVDVLGTNRQRRNWLLFWKDRLDASCNLTYYAVHAKNNRLAFRARQCGAVGSYAECSLPLLPSFGIERSLERVAPLELPVDETADQEFQPALDASPRVRPPAPAARKPAAAPGAGAPHTSPAPARLKAKPRVS